MFFFLGKFLRLGGVYKFVMPFFIFFHIKENFLFEIIYSFLFLTID